MLLGRFFVGTGMGLGPPVAALYVAEVHTLYLYISFFQPRDISKSHSTITFTLHYAYLFEQVSPAFVRGTYGSFTQIATCLGIMGSLFIGIPSKNVVGW